MSWQLNPGVPPGNETRIRMLESSDRELRQKLDSLLAMMKNGRRNSGGGGSGQTIVQFSADALFSTSDASFSATVRDVHQGSAVADGATITVQNRIGIHGGSIYAYAGLEDTTGVAIQNADTGEWHILDITPTACG